MNARKYQYLLSALIGAFDAGRFQELDMGEVRLYARAGAVSILLGEAFQNSAELSRLSEADWKTINEDVARMASEPPSQSPVENKGIALLMAWALKGAEQHS
jgi:hypothetical protein